MQFLLASINFNSMAGAPLHLKKKGRGGISFAGTSKNIFIL